MTCERGRRALVCVTPGADQLSGETQVTLGRPRGGLIESIYLLLSLLGAGLC